VITAQISTTSAKMVTPSGWTAPAAGQTNPTPPASTALQTMWGDYGHNNARSTPESACQIQATNAGRTYDHVTNNGNGTYGCYTTYQSSTSLQVTLYSFTSCSSGYFNSGSNCTLQDASLVQKPADGTCVIKRVGNTFSADSTDPDCSTKPATVTVGSNYITQTKSDGSSKTVTLNSDGTAIVTQSRPDGATNTTQTNTTNIAAPDASGNAKVTGQGSGSVSGTGTATGSALAQFDKSGLATESTQSGIKTDTAAIKDALTGTADTTLAGAQTGLDSAASARASALNGLNQNPTDTGGFSWGFDIASLVPAQCGCAPLTMTIQGHTGTFDWCPYLDQARDILGYMVYVGTLFMLVTTLVGTKKD